MQGHSYQSSGIMTNNKIAYPISIFRIIGICAALWLLTAIYLGLYNVRHTLEFQNRTVAGKIPVITAIGPPFILAILILLPWKQIKTAKIQNLNLDTTVIIE